jgi:hypothetical protein
VGIMGQSTSKRITNPSPTVRDIREFEKKEESQNPDYQHCATMTSLLNQAIQEHPLHGMWCADLKTRSTVLTYDNAVADMIHDFRCRGFETQPRSMWMRAQTMPDSARDFEPGIRWQRVTVCVRPQASQKSWTYQSTDCVPTA